MVFLKNIGKESAEEFLRVLNKSRVRLLGERTRG